MFHFAYRMLYHIRHFVMGLYYFYSVIRQFKVNFFPVTSGPVIPSPLSRGWALAGISVSLFSHSCREDLSHLYLSVTLPPYEDNAVRRV